MNFFIKSLTKKYFLDDPMNSNYYYLFIFLIFFPQI